MVEESESTRVSWQAVFPWIARAKVVALPQGMQLWWERDIPSVGSTLFDKRVGHIAQGLAERFPRLTLGESMPTLRAETSLSDLPIGTRGRNALLRRGFTSVGDILDTEVQALFEMPNVGVGTVDDILKCLVASAISTGSSAQEWPLPIASGADVLPENGDEAADTPGPGFERGVELLMRQARFMAALGRSDAPVFSPDDPQILSSDALERLSEITAISAAELFHGGAEMPSLATILGDHFGRLSEAHHDVLSRRVFADSPMTLDEIGQIRGVTRERIRQIEGKALGEAIAFLNAEGVAAEVAASIRSLVKKAMPLSGLIDRIPALGEEVPSVSFPAWRVIDRLDEAYEITDGWVASPTVASARTEFRALLEDLADEHGLTALDELDASEIGDWGFGSDDELLSWISYCGIEVMDGYVLTRARSINDRAAAVLQISAEPLRSSEILERLGVERAITSLKNSLSEDTRFARVGRDFWALAEWGMVEYTSIRLLIRDYLDANGGSGRLGDIVESIASTHGVARQSVTTYAMTHPFESRRGVVTLAAGPKQATKGPELSRQVYRRGDDWAYRVSLSFDHLRGSGSLMPPGFARVLGLATGDTVKRPTVVGQQSMYWTGMQPSFGSVRDLVMHHDFALGDAVFFVLKGDGSFALESLRGSDGSEWDAMLASFGLDSMPPGETSLQAIGHAIGLPIEPSPIAVQTWLAERGELDAAEVIEASV